MANGRITKEPLAYNKGDTIHLTGNDYMFGLLFTTGNQVYFNLPLDRPILNGTPTLASTPSTISLGTVAGKKDITNINSVNITKINGGLSIIIGGSYDATGLPPTYSPCIGYVTMDIVLQ